MEPFSDSLFLLRRLPLAIAAPPLAGHVGVVRTCPSFLGPGSLCPNTAVEGQAWEPDFPADQQEANHGSSDSRLALFMTCLWDCVCVGAGRGWVKGKPGAPAVFQMCPPLGGRALAAGGQGPGRGLGTWAEPGLLASLRISTHLQGVAVCSQAVWKSGFVQQDNTLIAQGMEGCHL